MASLTIRKLDEAIKDDLRLRSASNGRSVEEEVRVILREVVQNPQGPPQRRPRPPRGALRGALPRSPAHPCDG